VMAGTIGKRKQPFPSGGGHESKPRRPRMHRTDHNGVAASNGSASHHAGQGIHANEASDDDLETLSLPVDANAYSALLGALSSSAARHAHRQLPLAVAGKRAGKGISASDGSDEHARRGVAADSGNPVSELGNGSRKQQTAAQKTVSESGAEQRPKSRKQAPHAVDHGARGGGEAAAAAQGAALEAVPVLNRSAVSGQVARDAHTNGGGGGWGLTLENDATEPVLGGDGAEPRAEAAADEAPVQDFFSAHFDRCCQGLDKAHHWTTGASHVAPTILAHPWSTASLSVGLRIRCCNPTYMCEHNMLIGP